ncbi:MAG: hypothetical protein PHP45_07105 [Elusimicrobiales bacterium]|nr:hypothetical protein [Elusimicrobiales bacterium]
MKLKLAASMIVIAGMAGMAVAGTGNDDALNMAPSAVITSKPVVPAAPEATKSASAAWKKAVKKECENLLAQNKINNLPKLSPSETEVPEAARGQLVKYNHAYAFPTTIYKMGVENKPAYVVQNDSAAGMHVAIFAADGTKIDSGSSSGGAHGNFSWSSVKFEDKSSAGYNDPDVMCKRSRVCCESLSGCHWFQGICACQ